MTIPRYINYLEKHDPILLPFAMKVIKEEPNIKDVHHIDNLAEMLYAESEFGKKIYTADMIEDYLTEQCITLEHLYEEEPKKTSIAEQIVKNEEYDFLHTPIRADIFDVILAEADEPIRPRRIKYAYLDTVEQMNSIAKALATLDGVEAEVIDNFNGILMLKLTRGVCFLPKASKMFAKLGELADIITITQNPIDEEIKFGYGLDHLYEE